MHSKPFNAYDFIDTPEGRMMRRCRRLSEVPRWSIAPMLRRSNVAEHSFQVCNIALWLLEYHEYGDQDKFRAETLQECITHEHWEAITGDMPSMSKGDGLPRGDEGQVTVVRKCADLLEMMWWVEEERNMGNLRLRAIKDDLGRKFPAWWDLFKWGPEPIVQKPVWQDVTGLCTIQAWSDSYMHPAFEKMPLDELNDLLGIPTDPEHRKTHTPVDFEAGMGTHAD